MRLDGVLLVLFASCWFSATTLLVKALGSEIPAAWVVFVRNAAALPLLSWAMRRQAVSFKTSQGTRLIVRSVLGVTAMSLFFWVLPRIPVADATLLRSSAPIFAALWGTLFLGERLDRFAMGCIAAAFLGVYVTLRPSFESADMLPYLLAVLSGLSSSLALATVKTLTSKEEPPLRIIFYFGVVGSLVCLPWALRTGYVPTASEWGLMAGVGLTATGGQLLLTMGIGRAPVSKAALGTLFLLVLNIIGGWLFWGEVPDLWTWLGCLLITGGILGLSADLRRRLMVTLGH